MLVSPPLAAPARADSFRRTEFWILAALFFCVPVFEAPKNILWGLYLVVWFANRACARDFGGRWDAWDTLIATWIASGFVVASFAGLHDNEWRGALDLVRYGSVLWLLKRSQLSEREIWGLLGALAAGTVLALSQGYWRLLIAHSRPFLELNSVGHVNHSAIFLAIAIGALTGFIFAYWARIARTTRAAGVVLLLAFVVSEIVMQSRAAAGVTLAAILLLGLAWWPRSRLISAAAVACVVVGLAIAMVAQVEVIKKHELRVAEGNVLSFRGEIWNTALVAWQRFPAFGVGMDNYSEVNDKLIREWLADLGRTDDGKVYQTRSGHAHSLYLTTLAERGVVGVSALVAVLLLWLHRLVQRFPGRAGSDIAWALWAGSFTAWFVTVTVGLANTTLHHEHGLLAMILLGLWLGSGRSGAPNQ